MCLCLTPGSTLPKFNLFQIDKLAHLIVYAILAILLFYGWNKQNTYLWFHRHTLLKIFVLTFFYGWAIEFMQSAFTADRQYDFADAIANSAGAVTGSTFAKIFFRFFGK